MSLKKIPKELKDYIINIVKTYTEGMSNGGGLGSETVTNIFLSNNIITYVNEDNVQQTLDLTPYLDDTIIDPIAGVNINIDKTDPLAPIINSTSDRYRTFSNTTQNIVSNGILNFIVEPNLSYIPNQDVIIDADNTNYMIGHVESYNSTTGSLLVHIEHKTGLGTFSYWDISLGSYHVDLNASLVDYDNTTSGLTSSKVKDALDELTLLLNNKLDKSFADLPSL